MWRTCWRDALNNYFRQNVLHSHCVQEFFEARGVTFVACVVRSLLFFFFIAEFFPPCLCLRRAAGVWPGPMVGMQRRAAPPLVSRRRRMGEACRVVRFCDAAKIQWSCHWIVYSLPARPSARPVYGAPRQLEAVKLADPKCLFDCALRAGLLNQCKGRGERGPPGQHLIAHFELVF